ncbi:MAG: ATP phosphoribosyltransferase regulatory subunit [Deltaproteobacteria bacterium]|jgi:ATP phosphoribosyltransferase regulatory subunit|nr:ATP phosphoribosyltransferase regulatory subunit [Deltaproteobacteria bacterium]MCW8892572.1 ATP phosphoribosyltransferase regulatory subunit [Deltaproteobacteria bacterium]
MRFSDSQPETDLPKGVRDFLPLKAAKVEYLQQQLQQVYRAWGFRPLITPQLEYLDVLELGLGEGLQERTFRFDDRQSGRLLAFPPDMTPQIARIAATRMSELPLPLRLSYHGRVLRHTEQQAGKDRDIFQSGVELIGLDGPEADAEMIAMAIEALKAVGAKEFTVDIGQVEFFRGVMDSFPADERLAHQVADAILRKDSSELTLLLEKTVLAAAAREEILALPRLYGGREVLERAEKSVRNERSRRALDSLAQVLDVLEVYGVLEHVTVDLGELRGLNYHTGITFQGFLSGVGRTVCSGGRYNNLTAQYGFPAPATGFTFSLLHLLFALDKILDEAVVPACDLLIFSTGENLRAAQELACLLRGQGYSVARDILERSEDEALNYARQMNYRYLAVVAGEHQDIELIKLANGNREKRSWQQLQKLEL